MDPGVHPPGRPAACRWPTRPRHPSLRHVERIAAETREVALSRTELVLVHPQWTEDPAGPTRWLAPRHVDRHHHVRVDRAEDADRVARLVLSRGIGVVYSGGGARGIAEVGVLRALREANVPIDAVGGTSIGSILAGATARGIEPDGVAELLTRSTRQRQVAGRLSRSRRSRSRPARG